MAAEKQDYDQRIMQVILDAAHREGLDWNPTRTDDGTGVLLVDEDTGEMYEVRVEHV